MSLVRSGPASAHVTIRWENDRPDFLPTGTDTLPRASLPAVLADNAAGYIVRIWRGNGFGDRLGGDAVVLADGTLYHPGFGTRIVDPANPAHRLEEIVFA